MKYIGIETPCSEDFNSMLPNTQGSYCNRCEQNVIDFSVKSDRETIEILQLNDKLCGRFSVAQLERINKDLDTYSFRSEESFRSALVFSLFVVFGLSLFSCNDVEQKKQVEAFQKQLKQTYLSEKKPFIPETSGKPAPPAPVETVPLFYEVEEELIPTELPPPDTIALDEVVIKGMYQRETYTVGQLISTINLGNVPEAVKVEYDRNGMIIPNEFSSMAFPNPTAESTMLEIKLPSKEKFEIGLYDMNGILQREIYSGKIDKGTFQQEIEMGNLPPGMYLIMIVSKEYTETLRVSKI